jgi:hypothetical protein
VLADAPTANAERLVLTVRTELTDRMLIFGEWHRRRARWPCMPLTTSHGDRIERCNCVRHVRKRLSPCRSTAESGADQSSAA